MKKLICLFIMIMLMVPSFSYAKTEKVVDLEKLDPMTRNKVLDSFKETEIELSKPEKIKELAEIGSIVANSIRDVCKALSIEVNEFVKTDVGKLVTFLIIYKVLGKSVIVLAIGCFIIFITVCSFLYFHIPKKLKVKNEHNKVVDIKYIDRINFGYGTRSESIILHICVCTAACILIMIFV